MPLNFNKSSKDKQCQWCGKSLLNGSMFCSRQCKSESQKKRITLVCNGCGKNFQNLPYLKRSTNYCSMKCYWDSTRKKEVCKCKICGKEFVVKSYLVRKGYGLYCSPACRYPDKVNKICIQCNAQFKVWPTKASKAKFCSKKCVDDFMRDYVERVCVGCKTTFQIPQFEINRGRGSFCTLECFFKYRGETSIEEKVRVALVEAGIEFEQEVKFGRFHADFVLNGLKIVIECDGIYWHSRPWSKERDKKKDLLLQENGFTVIRLPEELIRKTDQKGLINLVLN